ncbi:MAG: hypothetical protein MUO21_06435 [Nitrososphaeraceae archaeon]|nr:hypothetical protein [Nitrososphaeraceae archaeon]
MEEQNIIINDSIIPIEKPTKKKSIKKVDKKIPSFAYTPLNHMKYKLAQLEGKEQIPSEVLEQIKIKLKENKDPITRLSIRRIIK